MTEVDKKENSLGSVKHDKETDANKDLPNNVLIRTKITNFLTNHN